MYSPTRQGASPRTGRRSGIFPTLLDYPSHDALCPLSSPAVLQARSRQFALSVTRKYRRADAARFPFRNRGRPRTVYNIEFPHGKHQDVIASLRHGSGFGERARTLYWLDPLMLSLRTRATTTARYVTVPIRRKWQHLGAAGLMVLVPGPTLKSCARRPRGLLQLPLEKSAACAGRLRWLPQPAAADYPSVTVPKRISIKFSHEGGGEKKNHVAECTTCHINITRAATPQV